MMLKKFIFFIKENTITPVALDEANVELIITGLINQEFYLTHLHIWAIDYQEALDKYKIAIEMYGQQTCMQITKAQVC